MEKRCSGRWVAALLALSLGGRFFAAAAPAPAPSPQPQSEVQPLAQPAAAPAGAATADSSSILARDRLPRKLSISFWYHHWLAEAQPGAPYEDLERCVKEMKERGFNAARVGVGMTYAFRLDGAPRGPMTFEAPIPGYGSVAYPGYGGRRDVLERVVRLLELAREYDVWIILTSWEYQDNTCVGEPRIVDELASVPKERRFAYLAEQWDRLLNMLKERGLAQHIAYVEIHNEPEYSDLPGGDEGKRLHEEALATLRTRHPDILFSADYATHNWAIVPDNAQVFDQHIYAGASWHLDGLYGRTVNNKDVDLRDPRGFEPLQRVLKQDIIPWDDFMKVAAKKTPREDPAAVDAWRKMLWLWENIDVEKWDAWMAESFLDWKDGMWESGRELFAKDAQEGKRRGLPLVFDEGGYFCPPPQSRWELTPDGLSLLELFADLAIQYDYWGFMPGTYSGPGNIMWRERSDWLRQINERFQSGTLSEQPSERESAASTR